MPAILSAIFLLIYKNPDELVIDLIATAHDYRRRGISSDLIKCAEKLHHDRHRIIVGTQVGNIASVRLYEKAGFRLFDSKYVFHYHYPQSDL